MLVYEKAKPLTSIDLNYEVVGGLTPPTTFNKENTVWVDTTVDKEKEAKVKFTEIAYYIGSDDGKVKSSSNVVKTAYFPCVAGHEYHFQLTDGQTVVISSFTQTPAKDVVGTNIYGSGSSTGLETLDYTITATESMAYLAIYYYNSSTNTSVPTLTITDNTLKNSLPDEYKLNEHAFSYENPWVYYEDVDLLEGVVLGDGYLANGTADTITTTVTSSNPEKYTPNHIPVKAGTTYNISYTITGTTKKKMWFAISEYTGTSGSYTLYGEREEPVNSISGLSQEFTYTPSANNVTAVRFSWRTFPGTECTVTFIEPNAKFCTAVIGDTWIKTDIDKAPASFNAIKRNELIVYPYKLKQWNGNKWKTMGGSLYQNDTAILIYNLQTPDLPYVLKNGLKEQEDITGGWKIDKHGSNDKWYFFGYDESTRSIRFAQRNMTSCRYGWVATNNKVNVSGWNKLVMRVSTYQGYGDADKCNGWVYVCLSNTQNAPMTSDDVLTADVVKGTYYYSTNSSKTEHIVEVDISGIDGEFYIVAGQRNKTSEKTFHCQIHDIYFED
jgi:hypothetical protein